MSASGKSVDNVHLDGEEESHLVLKGFTEQEMQEFDDEDIELGDIHIENTQYAHGLEDVNVKSVGSVQVPLNSYKRSIAVDNSSVETIRGDLSGRTVIEDSDIGKIRGDSSFSGDFARNSHNLNIHGNIEFQDGHHTRISDPAFFKNSNLPTVIGNKVEGDAELDKNSVGGLIVADDIDVEETNGNFFTISTEDLGWSSSKADANFPASETYVLE